MKKSKIVLPRNIVVETSEPTETWIAEGVDQYGNPKIEELQPIKDLIASEVPFGPEVPEVGSLPATDLVGTSIKTPVKAFGPDVLPEPVVGSISHDKLLKALYWVFDFMDRALINFYLVADTAQAIKAQKDLFGDKIQVAVRKNEWESGARRIADAFAPNFKDNGTTVEYEYEGVPVILHILEDSATLTNFDTQIYASEYFKLPNPYSEFEKEFSWLK